MKHPIEMHSMIYITSLVKTEKIYSDTYFEKIQHYCDMSKHCWATGGGTSYHEDRPLINGRLPG
jgi:hypothetical protein